MCLELSDICVCAGFSWYSSNRYLFISHSNRQSKKIKPALSPIKECYIFRININNMWTTNGVHLFLILARIRTYVMVLSNRSFKEQANLLCLLGGGVLTRVGGVGQESKSIKSWKRNVSIQTLRLLCSQVIT
jgi:uncharacterized YccA/Bax inhibitor family protein